MEKDYFKWNEKDVIYANADYVTDSNYGYAIIITKDYKYHLFTFAKKGINYALAKKVFNFKNNILTPSKIKIYDIYINVILLNDENIIYRIISLNEGYNVAHFERDSVIYNEILETYNLNLIQ